MSKMDGSKDDYIKKLEEQIKKNKQTIARCNENNSKYIQLIDKHRNLKKAFDEQEQLLKHQDKDGVTMEEYKETQKEIGRLTKQMKEMQKLVTNMQNEMRDLHERFAELATLAPQKEENFEENNDFNELKRKLEDMYNLTKNIQAEMNQQSQHQAYRPQAETNSSFTFRDLQKSSAARSIPMRNIANNTQEIPLTKSNLNKQSFAFPGTSSIDQSKESTQREKPPETGKSEKRKGSPFPFFKRKGD
ncbi:hypothetical protein [Bacillus sp. FJAT-50079]|uniref:hypothetical protein n=1 Tax=Bacillus sp. FJAT-50079 TaxID=2833577 RepID=UPI001BCA260C|nr:hypothetical protein [Bacillus sp. FJAT-50079]MBS4206952.1 hypothetical protein [Bacillus sp. FJAT-50079]